jgi:ferredoxin--NADP+ reductase
MEAAVMTLNKSAAPTGAPTGGQVAIIGCGPSGCYTAVALRRLVPGVGITVFDGRPTPFGLVRYGVAADHQGMKGVSRQFDRLFASDGVDFVGNTTIGSDLSLELLEGAFDVVVMATGLSIDRALEVPCHAEARVYGAGQLLRYLNADPDSHLRALEGSHGALGNELLVVGAGNVAMDVARLLAKAEEGFVGSDIDDDARALLASSNLRRIILLGRGPRDAARWDAAMFTELCALPGVAVSVDGEIQGDLAAGASKQPAAAATGDDPVKVDICFNTTVSAVDYADGRTVVRTRPTNGVAGEDAWVVDTVVTAMGFVRASPEENPLAHADPERLVWVGGCHSGVLGNLAENRTLAKIAAEAIADQLSAAAGRPGL